MNLTYLNNTILPFEQKVVSLPEQRYKVAEYFAGIGLVRLGLELAGWNIVFANDYAVEKYKMYDAFFNDAQDHYVVENIFNLNPNFIPKTLLATASFPCIDLSLAGNRHGINGKHSSAFWGFTEILKKQGNDKPKLVLLENVNGWLTSNNGEDFRLTIKALNSLGYACDVISLDAIRFTPQSRPRVFVIGMQIDHPNQDTLRLIRRPDSVANKTLKNTLESNFDLNWHILEIPEPPNANKSGLSKIVELLNDDDERWWSDDKVSRHLEMMHDTHRTRIMNHIDDELLAFRTMYRRVRKGKQRAEVRANDTAGCLRTASGGSSRQMVVQIGKGQVKMRHMTPREYARLQGVPDEYPISLGINQSLTGFGDAVCVPVITWIAKNILNPLANQLVLGE